MCIVRVILRLLLALPCKLGFVCLRDFLYAEELSKTVEGRCTAEWVQSTYATSAWTSLVLLGCFCTLSFGLSSCIFPEVYLMRRFVFFPVGILAIYPR